MATLQVVPPVLRDVSDSQQASAMECLFGEDSSIVIDNENRQENISDNCEEDFSPLFHLFDEPALVSEKSCSRPSQPPPQRKEADEEEKGGGEDTEDFLGLVINIFDDDDCDNSTGSNSKTDSKAQDRSTGGYPRSPVFKPQSPTSGAESWVLSPADKEKLPSLRPKESKAQASSDACDVPPAKLSSSSGTKTTSGRAARKGAKTPSDTSESKPKAKPRSQPRPKPEKIRLGLEESEALSLRWQELDYVPIWNLEEVLTTECPRCSVVLTM